VQASSAYLTIAAYHPAWNGGFIWDDDAYLTKKSSACGAGWFAAANPKGRRWFAAVKKRF